VAKAAALAANKENQRQDPVAVHIALQIARLGDNDIKKADITVGFTY